MFGQTYHLNMPKPDGTQAIEACHLVRKRTDTCESLVYVIRTGELVYHKECGENK